MRAFPIAIRSGLALFLWMALCAAAWAQSDAATGGNPAGLADEERPQPPAASLFRPGAYRHDGFFLRLNTGLGVFAYRTRLSEQDNVRFNTVKHTTLGVGGGCSIGKALRENLLMHFDFSFSIQPIEQTNYRAIEMDDRPKSTQASFLLGLGMTYYFMPYNLYLSGSTGVLISSLDLRDHSYSLSEPYEDSSGALFLGIGLGLTLGKEWWISENWGLGLALMAHYGFGTAISFDYQGRLHQGGLALLTSLSYN